MRSHTKKIIFLFLIFIFFLLPLGNELLAYSGVQIGTQYWMDENLNINTGTNWCYDNSQTNCAIYGRLYDWDTARNVCPSGWYLPSDNDWHILEYYLHDPASIGGCDPDRETLDCRPAGDRLKPEGDTGFNLQYGGRVRVTPSGADSFYCSTASSSLGRGNYWSSTARSGTADAWMRQVGTSWSGVTRDSEPREDYGISVRCISDNGPGPGPTPDPENTLRVRSSLDGSNRTGASISRTAGTTGTGGTTSYNVVRTSNIDTTLRAPTTHAGGDFSHWTGCDQTLSNRRCRAILSGGSSQTIRAHYTTPDDPENTIQVRSRVDGSLNYGASITRTAGTTGTGGTTYYSRTITGDINTTLRAPTTHDGADFSHWTGCTSTSGRSCQVVASGGVTRSITAHYESEPEEYTVQVARSGQSDFGATGRARFNSGTWESLDTSETFEEGTQVTVEVEGDEGYEFDRWNTNPCHGIADPECMFTLEDNETLYAVLKIKEHTVSYTSTEGGDVSINNDSSVTLPHGEDTSIPDIIEYEGYDHVRFTVIEGKGNGDLQANGSVQNVQGDMTVRADFEIKTYELKVEKEGEGQTDPSVGTHTYNHGDEIEVTTDPEKGWYFYKWQGDCSGSNCTLTMTENKNVKAIFERPAVNNAKIEVPDDYCGEKSASAGVSWEYSDPYGVEPEIFKLKVDGNEYEVSGDSCSGAMENGNYVCTVEREAPWNVSFNTSYQFTVQAENKVGALSNEAESNTVTTPYRPPDASFSWTPQNPFAEEEVVFFDSNDDIIKEWRWDFDDGSPSSYHHTNPATYENPRVTFDEDGERKVTLGVSSDHDTCEWEETVNVRPPLPDDWREIDPF